jgi:hypothetical protein
MDVLYALAGLASVVGAIGFLVGRLVAMGIVRWAHRKERAGRIAAWVMVALLAGVGIQQASAVRTVPKSNADAHAHDYSLAGLEQAAVLWVCGVNAVGAVIGIRTSIGRDRRRSAGPTSSGPAESG